MSIRAKMALRKVALDPATTTFLLGEASRDYKPSDFPNVIGNGPLGQLLSGGPAQLDRYYSEVTGKYKPMEPLQNNDPYDYLLQSVPELLSDEELDAAYRYSLNGVSKPHTGKRAEQYIRIFDEHDRRKKLKAEADAAAKKERDRRHIQQLRKETIQSIQAAQEANSPAGIARMTAQELGNNLLDIGNKALETGKNIGKKTLEIGGKAAKEGGKAAINWINAQADATRSAAETRREIAHAKNKAIEEQTAAIKAAQAAQAAKEAQVSQYLGYAPWLLGGGLAGAGLGSAIGSQYKNTLLGAILGGAGGVGLGGLGKYVYDKYVSKQASADVDYSGVERRAKFRAMLG